MIWRNFNFFACVCVLGLNFSCKTTSTSGQNFVEAPERGITAAETQAISSVVQEYYSQAFVKKGESRSGVKVSPETLAEFSRRLVEVTSGQTDIIYFRNLLDNRSQSKGEFETYIVQEFATKTNLFEVQELTRRNGGKQTFPIVLVK